VSDRVSTLAALYARGAYHVDGGNLSRALVSHALSGASTETRRDCRSTAWRASGCGKSTRGALKNWDAANLPRCEECCELLRGATWNWKARGGPR